MGKTLDALRHLHEVEQTLGDLRREEEAKRRQVLSCTRQLEKLDQELQNKLDAIRRHEVEIHNTELEISTREETVTKHRVALNGAKTNKEYAAILATINIEKADNSKLENRVLEHMSTKDTLQVAHDELAAQRDVIQKRQALAEGKLEAYLNQARGKYEKLGRERDEVSEALPPAVMSTFDRAAERLEGEAMAAVIKVNPKRDDCVCGGCNMSITLEAVNSLRTRDEIVLCNICGRILFLQD